MRHCPDCANAYALSITKRQRAEDPETYYARQKGYYTEYRKDPAFVAKRRNIGRWTHIKHKFGLGKEEWKALHAAQGGKCAICRQDIPDHPQRTKPGCHTDHDHETGRVRGLLCQPCNQGVGVIDTNDGWLAAALSYLERSSRQAFDRTVATG